MHFIPRVSNCCFCFSLKTGALILAWLGTVSSFASLMVMIVAITMGVDVIVNIVRDIEVKNSTLVDLGLMTFNDEDEQYHVLHLLVTILLLILLAMSLWVFIVNFLLLIGAHNRKPALVGQWLISALIWIVINVLELLYMIGMQARIQSNSYAGTVLVLLLTTIIRLGKFNIFNSRRELAYMSIIIISGIFIYWWICIYSFYHSIKHNKTSLDFKRHRDEYEHRCSSIGIEKF